MYQYLKESALAPLLIKAQKSVFSSTIGEHSTFFKGSSSDFVELREYTTGDDSKHIDWIISSKLDKPHVKVFTEQKELNIVIVSLLSASLQFGVQKLKLTTLQETLAILAFACVKQQDAYESYIYQETLALNTNRSKQIFNVRTMLENVEKTSLLHTTVNYTSFSSTVFKTLQKKSLLLLVGDFLNTETLNIDALAYKHEVIVIIIRDRFEENPYALGTLNITDPQTGLSADVNIDKKAALKIKTKLLEEDTKLYAKLHKCGVKHLKIYTDESPLQKLLPFMSSL